MAVIGRGGRSLRGETAVPDTEERGGEKERERRGYRDVARSLRCA